MKTDLKNIKNKALPILKEAGVIHSSIFGSVVQGETKEHSDIDMLIELPKEKSLFDFVDLQLKLEKALGKKVDLGEYSAIKPRLKESILNGQVQIL
jgi:uncharacterized protein